MRELKRYKGDLGEVVWLYDDKTGSHIIEIEYKGLYKTFDPTYDVAEALQVFWRTAYNLYLGSDLREGPLL
jgi:hypothetical protein